MGFRESETLDKEVIRVSFLTQDSGLGDAIARALGEDFSSRTISEWDLEQAARVCDACDVILLDLRTANTEGDEDSMLRLMDADWEIAGAPADGSAIRRRKSRIAF